MSSERLPVHIEPLRMVEARRVLHGQIPLGEMERLQQSVTGATGEVMAELEFGVDVEGIRFMRGRLQAMVTLQCQRCLDAMDYPIDSRFALALVRDTRQAEALPSHYEPLVVDGEPMFLRDVLEDELLLALPIVAKHDEGRCKLMPNGAEPVGQEVPGKAAGNPFSVLAGLKTDRN